jgi:pimeloyl-ACP methyl ester carboxylesterase
LCLFSSAATFGQFLGDDVNRCFAVVHGAAAVEYLARHLDRIENVVFDAAGPHVLTVEARFLSSLLDNEPVEIELDDDASQRPTPGTVVGFEMPFDSLWSTIDLTVPSTRGQQIKRAVKRQTRTLGDQGVQLRREIRDWLGTAATKAESIGGRQLAFLIARTKAAAAALSAAIYFHNLGPQVDPRAHIDQVADQLLEKATGDDEVARMDLDGQRIIRHTRRRSGDGDIGAAETALLLIDYWLAAPDEAYVAQVSFSTPHLDAARAITALADNLVLNGEWIVKSPETASDKSGRSSDQVTDPESLD